MFFKESEILAKQHPAVANIINQLDTILSEYNSDSIANTDDLAHFLGAQVNQIEAVLQLFISAGVLDKIEMIVCPQCAALKESSDFDTELRVAEENEQDVACFSCSHIFLELPKRKNIYRLSQDALENQASRSKKNSESGITHVVLLIHGIRTEAAWQQKAAALLNTLRGTKAIPVGYGFFDGISFWFPFFTRERAIKKIQKNIRLAILRYPGAKISIIAHSFGTYSFFQILKSNPDLKFHRVILCGSIIRDDYPWDEIHHRIDDLVNECGTRDKWPVLAKSCSWGYGCTGTLGFQSVGINDRYHDLDHSGFFDKKFIKDFWLPFIEKGTLVNSPWNESRGPYAYWLKLLSTIPIATITLLGAVAYVVTSYLGYW